jgi:hypothetical protein
MLRGLAPSVGVLLFVGCGPLHTITHYSREIRLTPARPTDKKLGITLVRVDPDGAAVIRVKKTNETLKALPGDPFLAAYGEYGARLFGESGLILQSSDVAAQSAVLRRHWAE